MKSFFKIVMTLIVLSSSAQAEELKDLLNSAVEYYKADNCAEALPFFDGILNADLPAIKDNATLAYSLNYYAGYCARQTGDPDKASHYFEKALKLAPDKSQIPVLYTFLGEVSRERGDYQKAETYYKNALIYLNADELDAALVWYFMAEAHRGMKKYDEALADCDNSTKISAALKSTKAELACITLAGEVYNEREDYPEAIKTFSHALYIARGAQLPLESANNNMGLALVYESLGKGELAKQNYDEALRLYTLSGNTINISLLVSRLLAVPDGTQEQSARSAEFYEQQTELLLGVSDDESLIWMQILIADYKRRAGNFAQAVQTYQATIELSMQGNFSPEAAKAAIMLSELQYSMNDFSGAMATLVEAERYHALQNPPQYLASIYAKQGGLQEELGRKAQAEISYKKAAGSALNIEEKNRYTDMMQNVSGER